MEIVPGVSPFACPEKPIIVERKPDSQRNSCSVISELVQTESEMGEERKKKVDLTYL